MQSAAIFIVTATPSKASDPQFYLQDYATSNTTLRAGFVPYKAQLVLGEPLQLTFRVENLGPGHFAFVFGGDWQPTGRHDRFKITVMGADGNVLPDPRATQFELGGMARQVRLTPGQSFSNIINLLDFRTIEKPGEYSVKCSFAFDSRWTAKKDQTNPVVSASFQLSILERTPERVLQVLDELVAKVQASRGKELAEILGLVARFGGEDAVPPLGQFATHGTTEQRVASLGALSLIPADESLEILLKGMNDPDTAIRIAAVGALGVIQMPRAVDALIMALPGQQSPVAKALLRALGTCKSERALPVLTNVLESGTVDLQRAAVNALAIYGGPGAIAVLKPRVNASDLGLRYEVVLALAEKLHQPMSPHWLLPMLMSREQTPECPEWVDSLRLVRMYAGDQAIPTLLSCLDFEAAWSGRNWWILNAVAACRNAPPAYYEYDPNSNGTSAAWARNLRTLERLKPLAGPIPALPPHPKKPPVPFLRTDPPIDFTPKLTDLADGGVEISSGFLTLQIYRGTEKHIYSPTEAYSSAYQISSRALSLLNRPEPYPQLGVTSLQAKQLDEALSQFARRLCGSPFSDKRAAGLCHLLVFIRVGCPGDPDWRSLCLGGAEICQQCFDAGKD